MNRLMLWSISIAIFLIAVAIAYYFAFFLPTEAAAEALSRNQIECAGMEEGTKEEFLNSYDLLRATLEEAKTGEAGLSASLTASTHYNKKLKECLIDLTYSDDRSTLNSDGTSDEETYVIEIWNGIEKRVIWKCEDYANIHNGSIVSELDSPKDCLKSSDESNYMKG